MKITEALSAEHAVFHNLFDHIERSAPRLKSHAEIRAVGRLLEVLLESHSRAEDRLLIEPLVHCFEQIGQRETFHAEHESIEASLQRAQLAREIRGARRHLLDAVLASRRHFDKEERIVFPMAEELLKPKTLLALGGRWSEQRNRSDG